MSAANPADLPDETGAILAAAAEFEETFQKAHLTFRERVYALCVARNPVVRARVAAAEAEIAAGAARNGGLTLADLNRLAESI